MSQKKESIRDLVIIGAGPAGLSASIYAVRALLDAVTIEQTAVGGQAILTSDIANYPGVPDTTGFELIDAMQRQAVGLGASIVSDLVTSISHDAQTGLFDIACASGAMHSRSVILATGATSRRAGFEGEEEFYGHGVSYCATCDGMFYRGKRVFVVGGGNAALNEALFLTRFASKVTLVVRGPRIAAPAVLVEEALANQKIEVLYRTTIARIEGSTLPSSITLRNEATKEEVTEQLGEGAFGVFVFVKKVPASALVMGLADVTEDGKVITDDRMATATPGLFCAGDVRRTPLRQIVTAAADGAIAATSASEFLGRPFEG